MHKVNKINKTVIWLVAIISIILGIYCFSVISTKKATKDLLIYGTLLEKPRQISNFKLTTTNKAKFSNNSLKNHWTLIFFGFTSCGYMCPTTMAELGKTYRLLEKQNITPLPDVVMISIDPKHDSIIKIDKYVKAFDKHFHGAVGNDKSIKSLTKELGIAYATIKVNDPASSEKKISTIEHSGAIMLFNPNAELTAFFTNPHNAENLAKDYALIVKN
jgi:protein SCO1/2